MTQEYTPTEINESTPEPTEDGIYLITSPKTGEAVIALAHNSDRTFSWSDFETSDHWEVMREDNIGLTIQSLADHDSEVAAEATVKALELTDKEADVAAEALEDADDESWYYDNKQQVIRDVLKAVAKSREVGR